MGGASRLFMTDLALRILLVEDNSAEARSLVELLNLAMPAAVVEVAPSLAAALERLSPLPDLILLDLGLPDANRQESYDRLHALAPLVPTVVVTGSKDDEMAELLIRHGAQDYLVKGELGGALLVRSIRQALERSRLMRELLANEKVAADRENYFQSLIENVSDVIGVLDSDGTLRYASPSVTRVLGYSPEEVLGKNTLSLVPDAYRDRWKEHLRRQTARPLETMTLEIEVRHKDGSLRSWEIITRGITTGHDSGMIANCRDITERKSILSRLEQAGRIMSLGRLAATIAHEINNVLMGIMPFAEIIQRKAGTDTTIQRAASQIVSSIGRGRRVTQEIIRFTQAVPPDIRVIDLGKFLEALVSEAHGLLGARIEVELQPPREPTFVWADPDQLGQVITNLMMNARDAIEGTGRVVIAAMPDTRAGAVQTSAAAPSGFAHIAITDSGPGIPEGILHHIFEPLFTTRTHGTGLGLAVAHQIMTQHNGEISAESDGNGTTFHLYLPRSPAAPSLPADAVDGQQHRPSPSHVLLIEDDPDVAMGLSMLLEDQGFVVRTVTRGEQAVPSVEASLPDLVILDVGLPDKSGVEVYQDLREQWPDLPVIFSTGHLSQIFDPGDSHVTTVLKPYTIEALIEAMERVGAGRHR